MDKAELAQKHPELLAQILAEARAETESDLKTAFDAQLAAAAANTAALVTAVAGKDVADQVSKLAASGVTAAQLEAIAPMLAAPTSGGKEESGSRADILAALRGATPPPVDTGAAPKNDDSVMATIERISKINT